MRKNREMNQLNNALSILTVDDDALITSTIQAYFRRSGYDVDMENDPRKAIERIREGQYDILLLDFLMSPLSGDRVVEEIRKFNKDISIILLTGHKSMAPPIKTIRELDIQGYYEKDNRFDKLELLVESCAKSIRQMRTIQEYQKKMTENYMEMVLALRLMVDARNPYTRGHSDRVAYVACDIACAMGMPEDFCKRIRYAGNFHDIGKLGITDDLLLKPDRLSDEEYDRVKEHCEKGAKILSAISAFQDLVPAVRSHHERMDGKGYPDGLAGEAIPLEARIIAVADAFDAMTSCRQYQTGIQVSDALSELRRCSGKQFDPTVVEAFVNIVEKAGEENYLSVLQSIGKGDL